MLLRDRPNSVQTTVPVTTSTTTTTTSGILQGSGRHYETFSKQHREHLAMGGGGGPTHTSGRKTKKTQARITVVVRKRPLTPAESQRHENDILSLMDEKTTLQVDEPRKNVCGHPYIETHQFAFDRAYSEKHSNRDVYISCVRQLVDAVFQQGACCSCFAYGQTGSGKTYTMVGPGLTLSGNTALEAQGLLQQAGRDCFTWLGRPEFDYHMGLYVSFFEIYCNRIYDLLNQRRLVRALETKTSGGVVVKDLTNVKVTSLDMLLKKISNGLDQRIVASNSKNIDSSRGHAILTLEVKNEHSGETFGKLAFIDLAGSERGADAMGAGKLTQVDGAGINRSLLALKECIRALDQQSIHVPFRDCELTKVLRDMFMGSKARTLMISCVSPSSACCEQTLNTLRYADRVKAIRRYCKPDVDGGGGNDDYQNVTGGDSNDSTSGGHDITYQKRRKKTATSASDISAGRDDSSSQEGLRSNDDVHKNSIRRRRSQSDDRSLGSYDRYKENTYSSGREDDVERKSSAALSLGTSHDSQFIFDDRRSSQESSRMARSFSTDIITNDSIRSRVSNDIQKKSSFSKLSQKNIKDTESQNRTLNLSTFKNGTSGEDVLNQLSVSTARGSRLPTRASICKQRNTLLPSDLRVMPQPLSASCFPCYDDGSVQFYKHSLSGDDGLHAIKNKLLTKENINNDHHPLQIIERPEMRPKTENLSDSLPTSQGKRRTVDNTNIKVNHEGKFSSLKGKSRTTFSSIEVSPSTPVLDEIITLIEQQHNKFRIIGSEREKDCTFAKNSNTIKNDLHHHGTLLDKVPNTINNTIGDMILTYQEGVKSDTQKVFPKQESDEVVAAASILRKRYKELSFPLLPETRSSSKHLSMETAIKMIKGLSMLSSQELQKFYARYTMKLDHLFNELVQYHSECLEEHMRLSLIQNKMLKDLDGTKRGRLYQTNATYLAGLRQLLESNLGTYIRLGKRLAEIEKLHALQNIISSNYKTVRASESELGLQTVQAATATTTELDSSSVHNSSVDRQHNKHGGGFSIVQNNTSDSITSLSTKLVDTPSTKTVQGDPRSSISSDKKPLSAGVASVARTTYSTDPSSFSASPSICMNTSSNLVCDLVDQTTFPLPPPSPLSLTIEHSSEQLRNEVPTTLVTNKASKNSTTTITSRKKTRSSRKLAVSSLTPHVEDISMTTDGGLTRAVKAALAAQASVRGNTRKSIFPGTS